MLLSPLYLRGYRDVHAWQYRWLTQKVNAAIQTHHITPPPPNGLQRLSIPGFHLGCKLFLTKTGRCTVTQRTAWGQILFLFPPPVLHPAPSVHKVLLLWNILRLNAAISLLCFHVYTVHNVDILTYYRSAHNLQFQENRKKSTSLFSPRVSFY